MIRPRPFASLPYLLGAVGIGLAGYYGERWYQLPQLSPADIDASVELNLQLDLARRGPNLQPDAAGMARMRELVREEVIGSLEHEKREVQQRFAFGLIALIVSIGQIIFLRLSRRV